MSKVLVISLLIALVISDCPINYYPRQTVTGSVAAQFNNNPQLHGTSQQYTYSLEQSLQQAGVSVAIGVVAIQLNSHNQMDFYIQYLPSTQLNILKFRVLVNDPEFGWKTIRFSFLASQSFLFQTSMQVVTQFSTGIQEGKYSVYRPILNFNNFQVDPIIRIFMCGIQFKSKQFDSQYYDMLKQYESFKKFSSNTQLVTYFGQAMQEKKALSFRVIGGKILGRLLTFSVETNTQLKSFRFSYLIFSRKTISQKHSFIIGDFYLINGNQYKFSSLQNMNMLISGVSGFKFPRDKYFYFSLSFDTYFGQSYFDSSTNFKYFMLDFTFAAFQIKQKFACQDCQNSPNIFQNKFCVQTCPRGYSKIKRLQNFFCQKCQMDKLKVVDVNTGDCVCARRHFLDASQDTCKPCSYDCMTCSQIDKCLTCDNSLLQTKRKLNNIGRCDCPSVGYYDDKASEDIVCQKCSSKCLTCNGPHLHDCISCPVGKQLDPFGFCRCKNGYFQDSNQNCVCNPPNIIFNNFCVDTQSSCKQNQIEQYVQVSRRCVCKSDYIQLGDECIKCGANSYFDKNELKCKCMNRTVYVNGQCVSCGQNQIFDQISEICICKYGTFKTLQGKCVTCPLKMAYINQKCECIFNYYQSGPGVCQRCLRQTDGPKCRKNSF